MAFSGTRQKCKVCDKMVYVMDQLTADVISYHKACFKCSYCKGILKLSNYSSLKGVLYCKPHFEQLFKETSNFNKSIQSHKITQQSHSNVLLNSRKVCYLQKNCIPSGIGVCCIGHRLCSVDMVQRQRRNSLRCHLPTCADLCGCSHCVVGPGEQFYLGGIIGVTFYIIELYPVLWGKNEEKKHVAKELENSSNGSTEPLLLNSSAHHDNV